MKTLPAKSSTSTISSPTRTIAVIAMLLFALSGLLSGFAVGAFIRPKITAFNNFGLGGTTVEQRNGTSTPTTSTKPKLLGFPVIDQVTTVERADGSTTYTFSAHAVDQSIDKGHGYAIHASGITCKLWLMKQSDSPADIPQSNFQSVDTISNPVPGEISGALNFDTATPQTQPCNADGQGTWRYQISSSIDAGRYYLVVLTDWAGKHYNWSWIGIKIKKEE